MKKLLYLSVAIFTTGTMLTSCDKVADDYDLEDINIKEMCGTWMCKVEANDAYWTDMYYINGNGYTADFINSYFGDPYGYYNPDVNGDGIVNLNDLLSEDYDAMWYDENEVGFGNEFHTSNTSANGTSEMWIVDPNWKVQYKVDIDLKNLTFGTATKTVSDAHTIVTGANNATTTLSSLTSDRIAIPDSCNIVVLDGKILKGAAHAPGSGMERDSIVFYVKYGNDYGEDMYYKVSGYRKTGYTEDD